MVEDTFLIDTQIISFFLQKCFVLINLYLSLSSKSILSDGRYLVTSHT